MFLTGLNTFIWIGISIIHKDKTIFRRASRLNASPAILRTIGSVEDKSNKTLARPLEAAMYRIKTSNHCAVTRHIAVGFRVTAILESKLRNVHATRQPGQIDVSRLRQA